MSSPRTFDQAQIDALLRFLPAFKRQGFWFERVVWEGGQISEVEKGPEARMFLRTLRDHGWLLPSGSWRENPEAWVQSSASLRTADLATLLRVSRLFDVGRTSDGEKMALPTFLVEAEAKLLEEGTAQK